MEGPVDLASLTPEQFTQFIDSFDTVITDCDGVLYKLYKVIPGVTETIEKFKELKKDVRFLSNNTSMGLEQFHEKLNSSGFKSEQEDIIYPTLAIIDYLKSINFEKKVFVIGFSAVRNDFIKAGINVADNGPDVVSENIPEILPHLMDDPDVGAIVLEMDVNLNYIKLLKASIYMRRPDVLFLVGATDDKLPTGKLTVIGPGYFYRMLEDFTGKKAMVFGKPSKNLSKYVYKNFKIKNPERTLFIGDSLYQDMSFASHCNFQKLLVLTGINTLEEAKKADDSHKPDYYVESLGDVCTLINKHMH